MPHTPLRTSSFSLAAPARRALTAVVLSLAALSMSAPATLANDDAEALDSSTGEIAPAPAPTGRSYVRGNDGTARGASGDALAVPRAEPETAEQTWKLLDHAARGKPGARTIFGTDDRVRINPTTPVAASMNVLITFRQNGVALRCSGAMIGPDTVATAGHCVHSGGTTGNWSTNVVVFPGRNGNRAPFGSCPARRLHAPRGWTRDKLDSNDYGAIKLNCDVGFTTGWYGLLSLPGSLRNVPANIRGYPADKALTLWGTRTLIRTSDTSFAFYRNDTDAGVQGAGVFNVTDLCGRCIIAIHTDEASAEPGAVPPFTTNNYGVRLRPVVLDNLAYWTDLP